ncbi:F-box/LRR-repeat protein [Quillaja saponaria]|uniref:F-box/LRR-repeat protein n=1 Tax=Quillaja saponaria TaxID=32244 RepID=A0AAD7VHL4_QUISA|nr:F-box/LRR-repeat protein [Quillaja saponaria]
MEKLPVEVIRKILSHLGSARDVVLASTTCKHLRKGFCLHRHTLSFNSDEMNAWPIDDELETIITKTIFQTTGLQYLTIFMDDTHEFRFNATSVTAWLKYTRDSLLQLRYNVRTYPNINIIENFNRKKLEVLVLVHNSITSVYPSYLEFPWLKSLSLSHFSVSALDLSFLLTACPKLETLSLVDPEITMSGPQKTMKVSSSSLKSFYVEELRMDKFILEADFLDSLYLKECTFEIFKLTGKGTLRVLRIDHVKVIHLEIGDSTENLEVVDVSYSRTIRPEFYRMILKSANLYKIRLWDVIFDNAVAVVVDLIPHYLP